MNNADMVITTRAELSDLIRRIKAAVADGSLRQVSRSDRAGSDLDFSQLEPDGQWPDVIEADFVDGLGQRFHIEVETYHGAGGRWARL